jgi:hypothetical protein
MKIIKVLAIIMICCLVVLSGFMIYAFAKLDVLDGIGKSTESFEEWAEQFQNISAPDQTVVLSEGYAEDTNTGNDPNLYYAYYWLLQTDLSIDELQSYYQTYIDYANKDTIGLSTVVGYQVVNQNVLRASENIPALESEIQQLEDKVNAGNEYWVIYAVKPGRWWNKN